MVTFPKNKKISLFWILQISGWFLYWAAQILVSTVEMGWSLERIHRYSLSSLCGFFVTLLLRYLYRKVQYQSRSILSLAVTGSLTSLLAANALVWLANLLGIPFWGTESTLFGNLTVLNYLQRVFWWLIPFFGWSALYFGIKFWQEWQLQKKRTESAQALVQAAQLQILRYRLNPHFLFNALNAIRALIGEDKASAKKMLTELSEFLRYSLISKNYPEVPLKQEIESIHHYFAVEKARYENKLQVSFDLDPQADDYPVISFLIHPLVENAIKHGMRTSPKPLKVHIRTEVKNGKLLVEVRNSGQWIKPVQAKNGSVVGSGLENVRQRLKDAFPGRNVLDVSEREGFVHARLEIQHD